jgi:tight adherence protein B
LGELHRDLEVALTGPAATARMVMVLPVVGIVFGALLGFNTLATLFLTVPGWLCLVLGGGLMAVGHSWNRRLVEQARVRDPVPGLELDLAAIGMTGGGSAERAQTLARAAMDKFLPTPTPTPKPTPTPVLKPTPAPKSGAVQTEDSAGAIARVLALSSRAGIPAAALLRSEAAQLRRECRSAGQRAAAALSVKLMIPLGVCVLPAFMLLGVIPLLVTVLSSTFGKF